MSSIFNSLFSRLKLLNSQGVGMMLKRSFTVSLCWLLLICFAVPAAMAAEEKSGKIDLTPASISSILMDMDTGTMISGKNMDQRLAPASITKIMTMLLIMEALDQGKLKIEDKVRTSEFAASMGGSQIFLEPGEEMTVDEMLKGIALSSGNDASVAMAEKIAGTEEGFVQMMNERAKQLGMDNTHFVNSSGLPAEGHYSSARDIAIMSRELLKHEAITKYTGLYQDYLRKDTSKPFWLVNTNKLVRFYSGADGLKTGYTSEARYCLSATAKRDNLRVIAVVMGSPDSKTRNAEVARMFDYAFSQYSNYPIFKQGEQMGILKASKGSVREVPLVANQQYSVLLKKGEAKEGIRHELQLKTGMTAPIEQGENVGKLLVYNGDKIVSEFDIDSPVHIAKAGWWMLFTRTAAQMFFAP